jgi:hypothetical protein
MSRQMKVALNLLTIQDDPANAREGDVYYNVITKNLRIFNGTVWIELTPPSDDPTPFYEHTHTYDGKLHTVDVRNPIRFQDFNENAGPAEALPIVAGIIGGGPEDDLINPNYTQLTLFSGGAPDSIPEPEEDYTLLEGGASQEQQSTLIDFGGA